MGEQRLHPERTERRQGWIKTHEGAHLVNAQGERFMTRYEPAAELASRDLVSRAIVREEARSGGPVFLSLRHLDAEWVRRRFPTIAAACRDRGLDLATDPIPVSPAAHYMMGGVATDLDGRTTLPGLYAAGEAACTGVHGANRLASNSLLEGLVFGARAARAMQQTPRAAFVEGSFGDQGLVERVLAEQLRAGLRARTGQLALEWLWALHLSGGLTAEASLETLHHPVAPVREWTVATFVVHDGRVLLLFHAKIGLWLPPGGHVEHGELPDEAAVREVLEETGVRCRLVGGQGVQVAYPRQLTLPFGVQLENIRPGVQHIDLVYFAVSEDDGWHVSSESAERERAGWYAPEDLPALGANDEIQQWAAKVTAYVRDAAS